MATWKSHEKWTMKLFATSRSSKLGCFNRLQKKCSSAVIIGGSIATRLGRYPKVWKKYFLKTVSLAVGGERVQRILWRVGNTDVPNSTQIVMFQCRTNNIDHNKPSTIANRLMKIASVLIKESNHIKITITGLLTWDKNSYN